jgi:TonB family protein
MARTIPVLLLTGVLCCPFTAAAQELPPYSPGRNVTAPKLLKEVKPGYTAEALGKKITGNVWLECVVKTDGTPSEIRVTRGLEPSLDAEAVKSMEQWRFKPGEKDGAPVPVKIEVMMSFTIGDKKGEQVRLEAPPAPQVYESGNGVSTPVVLHSVNPQYTPGMRRASVQGSVMLKCTVMPDGSVSDVTVSQSLDPELDQEATKAAKQWRFRPGKKDGQPVPVRVTIEMTFSLR